MLIRIIANILLFMFLLPALGLVTFTGGLGTGLLAAILVGIVGAGLIIALLPVIASVGVIGSLLSGAIGGRLGLILFGLIFNSALYALSIAGVAYLLPGLALIGFWPTIGAGAVLGLVSALMTPSNS